MKKSNLIVGILYFLVGVTCLLVILFTESKLEPILFGFAGAGTLPGLLMIYRYFHWNSPKNREIYQEKLENEKIEMHDELKQKLRDKSGRYAYVIGILIISISMLVFSILGQLGIIYNSHIIVLFLGVYLVVQVTLGIVIFNHLLKKYE